MNPSMVIQIKVSVHSFVSMAILINNTGTIHTIPI